MTDEPEVLSLPDPGDTLPEDQPDPRMRAAAPPRGINERVKWFLSNSPGGVGWCARHSWRSLGGDRGNPPPWGASSANIVYDKVKASGRFWTSEPPRGALILWKYGQHGHAAIGYGDGKIATTDPRGKPGRTGVESLSYPSVWGASSGARIWTDQYAGVRFDVEKPKKPKKPKPSAAKPAKPGKPEVYLKKLEYGVRNSASVRELQRALNRHGANLKVTGNYLAKTDAAVRACQKEHDFGADPAKKSSVGPKQAKHLFGTKVKVIPA